MICIVSIKIPPHPNHNPKNKQRGVCPIQNGACTDTVGSEHSYLESGDNINEIETKACKLFNHITRIEQVNYKMLREIYERGYHQAMKDYVAGKWKVGNDRG